MKKKKNTDKKITRRTLRLEARVTEQEYTQVAELAKTCGLSMSGYIRRTALGQHPRQRLTNREVEALCSLTDARGDLFQRYPVCGAMDESCYSAYQSLEPDRKLPY